MRRLKLKTINIVFYSKWDSFEKWKKILLPYKIKLFNWPDDFKNKDKYYNIDGALVWDPPENIWEYFPNIKIIQSLGAGVEHIINNPYPKDSIILKLIDPDLGNQMADYALMAVLMCQRNFFNYSFNKTNKKWDQVKAISNNDFNISILGYGTIAKLVIKKLKYMGFNIKVWGRTKRSIKNIDYYHGLENLKNCIKNTSCLISILPNTNETYNLIGLKHFKLLDNGGYFINIGRGSSVIEEELIFALNKFVLSGAILDVFQNEPLDNNSKLWSLDNVYLTPHIAGITNPTIAAASLLRDNFDRLNLNKNIQNKVNSIRGY
jgi:glyoxylate/hydroxypyruvate reductase A